MPSLPADHTRILIVGISVRALAESAVRAGYPVVALDCFGDQDLRSLAPAYSVQRDFGIPYSPKALYETGRRLGCETVAYTSNLENHPEILDLLAVGHGIIGNSPGTVRAVRNWTELFSKLERAGFPVPETIRAAGPDTQGEWLIKPVLSGGGHGVAFYNGQSFDTHRSILQRFVPGKSCSASFVANGRESVVIGISEQLIGLSAFGVQGFRYCGSIVPLPDILDPHVGEAIIDQTRRIASFLTREFGMAGVNGFDFILDGDQVRLIEVNPRYTASMELIEQAYGLPIFHLHRQSVMENRIPEFSMESLLHNRKFFGKSILFSEKDSAVPESLDWQEWDVRDIPEPGERLRRGRPVCTLLAGRSTYEDTLATLIRQAETLKGKIHD